ncbi:MAG: membrane protein insertase YidC [Candidatus Hydrogenedentes bacterium]|nr:membrane protein insertase YidC [Candidatus Hydrogenedentota bacterium]
MRNQMVAMMLVMLLVVIWVNFFMPAPQPRPQTAPVEQKTESEKPSGILEAEPPVAGVASGWPNLPPVPAADTAVTDVSLKNEDLELVFTPVGARLKQARVYFHRGKDDMINLVPESPDKVDAESVYPMGIRFTEPSLRDELDRRIWEVSKTDLSVAFSIVLPNAAKITKTFTLTDSPHVVDVHVSYENLETAPRRLGMDDIPAYVLNWGPNVHSLDLQKGVQQQFIWHTMGATDWVTTAKFTPTKEGAPYKKTISNPDWVGLKSAYFLVAFKPESDPANGWVEGTHEQFRFGVAAPRFELAAGETKTNTFKLYVGPNETRQLKEAWATLDTALRFFDWGFMDWFAKILLALLNFFHSLIPNYGVAIIILTVLVRSAMYPLTLKQMKSMKRMQLLAPEMEKLKEKYKDNPQELQQQIMLMYKERGVNPLGGCLPMLLQLPVFIALYRMLWSAYELRGAPFILWMTDLSEPDKLLHIPALANLPLGNHIQFLNVLPLLCAVAMVISTRIMPSAPIQDPTQKTMMTIMPVFFSLICYSFASGLNLYILVSTVLGIAQNKLVHVSAGDVPEKVQPKRKQNWYAAAMARRRQAAKDTKKQVPQTGRDLKENGKRKEPTKSGDATPKDRRSK